MEPKLKTETETEIYFKFPIYLSELVILSIQGEAAYRETDKRDIRLIGVKFWKRIRI